MARMITLDPAPKVPVPGGGWYLIAPDAGRYGQGLRSTWQLWNGTLQYSQCVEVNDAHTIDVFVQAVATSCSLAPALIEPVVFNLMGQVEGVYRQVTTMPPSQQARSRSIVPQLRGLSGSNQRPTGMLRRC